MIIPDGRCITEIKNTIERAKAAFYKMKSILCNIAISWNTGKRMLNCYNDPILIYGSESWTINKQTEQFLEATEMWFLRRMLKIKWTDKVTKEDCLKRAK
jgi:hypothetical protein